LCGQLRKVLTLSQNLGARRSQGCSPLHAPRIAGRRRGHRCSSDEDKGERGEKERRAPSHRGRPSAQRSARTKGEKRQRGRPVLGSPAPLQGRLSERTRP
jgi:hypothetical protein